MSNTGTALPTRKDKLRKFGKSRKLRIVAISVLLFFIIFSVTGFFILPPYIKKTAVARISEQLGRKVSIEDVSLNPYTLEATIKGIEIKEADGKTSFVSFGNLYANLQLKSILKGAPVLKEIRLEKPYLHMVRTGTNAYNFSDIIEKLKAAPGSAKKEKSAKPFYFLVNNINIVDGHLEFDDRPVSTRHSITQINLSVPFISDLPAFNESYVEPALSAVVNGTPMNFKGATKIFSDSHETSFDLSFKNIDIPYYLAYAPEQLNVNVPSGKLDISMKLAYRQYKDRSPMLVLSGETRARNLSIALKKDKNEFLNIPLFSVRDISFDLDAKTITIGSVSTGKGRIDVLRASNGKINLASIIAANPSQKKNPEESGEKKSPWIIVLKSLAVDDYAVKLSDRTTRKPFGLIIDNISCKADNITTAANTKSNIALSMRVDRKGTASVRGDFMIDPIASDLSVDIKGMPIKPVQPYLAEKLKAILASGYLNVKGQVNAKRAEKGEMKTAFKGKLWVNKFALLDKANAEDLIKWDTMYMGEMDVRYAPLSVHIREISLSNPYSRVTINANRTINLQEIFAGTETGKDSAQSETARTAAAETPKSAAKPQRRNIRIDRITLQGGTINLTDNSISPRFSGNLSEIGGRISGLSSQENQYGDVELRGKYDRYAPLEITGRINPLRDDLYVELKADFKDMDLTPVSPYSGRYAGYTIQKGKLSFRLEYLIVKNKLDAKNNIFLDQFTFGDQVESPDATRLPVKLAVALLKNRNGEINLDIPVSGDLKDPKFSIGSVIVKVIVNLLTKAATAPFALLGAIFGGGEQLGYAEFDYGSTSLTADTTKKLDTLGKALNDRPALKMDITGHVDMEKDREGLKQFLLARKVKAQKLKSIAKSEAEAPSLDSVKVSDQEYAEYLKRAYKAEKFPKPRNFIGMAKDLPVPEMEKLMITNMKITEDDMRSLATERARAVRNYLVQASKVDQERIFIVDSKTLDSEKKEGVKSSRTDFKLK